MKKKYDYAIVIILFLFYQMFKGGFLLLQMIPKDVAVRLASNYMLLSSGRFIIAVNLSRSSCANGGTPSNG